MQLYVTDQSRKYQYLLPEVGDLFAFVSSPLILIIYKKWLLMSSP